MGVLACATPTPTTTDQMLEAPSVGNGGFSPGPQADAALAGLFAGEAFSLPPTELAKASGGKLSRFADVEPLLSELVVTYDESGRAMSRYRTVYRILRDNDALKLQSVGWAAWHQKRPVIKTRVVGLQGDERWLDPATIVEGSRATASDMLTDARVLRAPLPGARVGSVVESLVVLEDQEPAFPGAASGRFETWQFNLRRARLVIEHPLSLPLTATVIGEGQLQEMTQGGMRRLSLDIVPSRFSAFAHARLDVPQLSPRVEWSTAKSWRTVAQGYSNWVESTLADKIDVSTLTARASAASSRREKIQTTLAWLRERVRYMALHLGAGALKPTPPNDVVRRGYGDCKDLSVAMVSALQQLGVDASVALVKAGGIPTNEQTPGISGFDHAIVYIPAQGADPALWVDATAEGFPVGSLPNVLLDRKALVVKQNADGLTPLPTRASTTSRVLEELTIEQSEFGPAKATLARSFDGPIAGWMRARFAKADARELEAAIRPNTKALFGDDPLTVQFENAEPSLKPPRWVIRADRVDSIDTGGLSAAVLLEGPPIGAWADEDWIGRDGARKAADPEAEKRRAQDILEATGLTEEVLEARPIKLDERLILERRIRVIPAPGFVAQPLPPSRTIRFGPATWSESFETSNNGIVEVLYRFDSGGVDFDAASLSDFRKAYWKWDKESWPRLSLIPEADSLFQQARPVEAMNAWRSALAAHPKKGILRARYAQALSNLGLDELAKPELERALKDTPAHPLTLMIEGDIRRRGKSSILYGKGFDRAGAIRALRAAIAELPRHSWPRFRLAELLERDVDGDLSWNKSPEVLEAIRLYEQLADEGISDALAPLFDAQLRLGRFKDIITRKQKERQSLTADIYGRAASLTIDGPELCTQYLRGIEDAQQRSTEAAALLGIISLARDYSRVDSSAAAFEPTLPGGAGTMLRSIFSGIRATSMSTDLSSPEASMRSVLVRLAAAPSVPRRVEALKQIATTAGAEELERLGLGLLGTVAAGPLTADAILSKGACSTDVTGKAAKVTCSVRMGRPVTASGFFIKEQGAWRLESAGAMSTLAANATTASKGKDVEGASTWLNWTAERIDQLNLPSQLVDLRLFRSTWPPTSGSASAAEVDFVSAQARLFGTSSDAQILDIAKAFEAARPTLAGAKKRLAEQVLSRIYLRAQQPAKAVAILKPLAEAEQEDALFQALAGAYTRAGQFREAKALTSKALTRAPSDTVWASLAASVAEREGNHVEARKIYEAAYARTNDEDLVNNLLWARYMTGLADEESEKMARALTAKKSASPAELHTAAVVLVERGKIPEAAQLAQRLALRTPENEPDEALLQLRAQLLQSLGFATEAKSAWNALKPKEPTSDIAQLKARGLRDLETRR